MTTIINLYGGPGVGKSTAAAYLYYHLKTEGQSVELVREYVKDWVWEGKQLEVYDQFYLMGAQARRETLLYDKVDWIVTDSPVMLSLYYSQTLCPLRVSEGIRAQTLAFYHHAADEGHKHIHVFLKRTRKYQAEGRYQSEQEARNIDDGIRRMLKDLRVHVTELESDEAQLQKLYASMPKPKKGK